ncbi:twin-arginine translocase TatA/TatE family subunit [Chloroflexota bacterium]
MGFLDMGTWEILLILVVALIIWGPGKIPEIARTLGQTLRALRKATFDLTTAVTKEIDFEKEEGLSQPKANSGDHLKKLPDVGTTESSDTEANIPRDQ